MQSDKHGVQSLVRILAAHGLKHVVISPGSRHAPISLSFFNHPDITHFVVPDERAAAYFALGIAQYTGQAVAVVCTSGTAAMNYGPAIAEAFYQEVPLIVITADRPVEWVDQGDGQTIRQRDLHLLHTFGSYELALEDTHSDVRRHNDRLINTAWNTANGIPKGPVHLNVPLREPLYGVVEQTNESASVIEHLRSVAQPESAALAALAHHVHNTPRVLVITGMNPPDEQLQKAVQKLAELPNVLVMTETGSNITGHQFLPCIDRLLMSLEADELAELAPDLLITFGTNIVSKKIKAFIRRDLRGAHWHIDPVGRPLDTFKHLTRVIHGEAASVFEALATEHPAGAKQAENPSNYRDFWLTRDREQATELAEICTRIGWSDLQVFNAILSALPGGSVLQMGNSSVVRYIQLFNQREDLVYYGNRGTSGIDGCTATASGMAAVSDEIVTLITGDIAFLYDINGLWHQADRSKLRIILINNGGGNIFKIIEGPKDTNALEEVFEARHSLDAKHLAAHFGISYFSAQNQDELQIGLEQVYSLNNCSILEIHTANIANESVLLDMFKALRQKNKAR